MKKIAILIAALLTLGACALTDGGGASPGTQYRGHVCQTGGNGCG